jgi:Integrase core domain
MLSIRRIEEFDTLLDAQDLVGDWRDEYNDYRPHSALVMLTPKRVRPALEGGTPTTALIGGGPTRGVRPPYANPGGGTGLA